MGILTRLRRQQAGARPQASITSAHELAQELTAFALGGPSASGIAVTSERAMAHPAVFAPVRVLSETVAQLPFGVFRRTGEGAGEREALRDHPLQRLLGSGGRPNDWQSPFELKELLLRQTALRGNGYAFKRRVQGQVEALLPIHPNRVEVKQNERFRITYTITTGQGSRREFGPRDIFHLRGPSDNGFRGDDLVVKLRDAIGLAIAQDTDAAKMFANGARIASVLEHPGHLGDEAFKRIKESFDEVYGGVENAHKTAILEEGMKLAKAGMTSQERESLDARKLQRSILAAVWRVPPHMVGDLERATFSNIENLARQFVDYALMPWLVRVEQMIEAQLLAEGDRTQEVFVKLDPRALLRGDHKTRGDFYQKALQATWMSPNEVRAREDLPPREGGDLFINPSITPGRALDEALEGAGEPSE